MLFLILVIFSQRILIPMDNSQINHLRAYGAIYNLLLKGINVEWLLYYRGGSFLIDASEEVKKMCIDFGVSFEMISDLETAILYDKIEKNNMNRIILETAPKLAVYIPPYAEPWDDAVTLALEYAKVPYSRIYDEEIIKGELKNYDWLHMHHEDFTGQYSKFYPAYGNTEWYREMVETDRKIARKLGFRNTQELKREVAVRIREFVRNGGFLFSMCLAPTTMDIALAAKDVDICDTPYDSSPPDPDANNKLDYKECIAFENFKVYTSYLVNEHSDIDVSDEAILRGPESYFTLFEFSAKYDPVPSMLVQNHVNAVKEFLGRDTGFRKNLLKPRVVILGEVNGTDEVKYIYGSFGKGFFTYLGGHDPEDYQHFIGDPPTDLSKYPNSPGYRLILNNILFPASQPRKLKT